MTDGDKIHFAPYWSIDPTQTIDAMMHISEHLDISREPSWYQEIKSIILFDSTEGGTLPSSTVKYGAYIPIVTTGFNGNLDETITNIQALAEAVDNLLPLAEYAPTSSTTIPAGKSIYFPDYFEVVDTYILTLADTAIMEIG
jgi:hypothetical protein